MFILDFVLDILGDANFLIAIIVALGLIIQKKSFSQILSGAVKATIGLMVLNGGSGILLGPLGYLTPLVQEALGVEGMLPNNESFLAIANVTFGSSISLILLGAFLVNIVIARLTPWKYVNLVTHHGLFAGALCAVIFADAGITNTVVVVVASSLLAGFWSTMIPAYCNKYMEKACMGQPIAMGHYGGIAYLIGGLAGEMFGDPEDSTEKIEMPKGLEFLKENVLMCSLIMALVFVIMSFLVSHDFMVAQGMVAEDGFRILWAITQGLTFGAGLSVLLTGVRMMLAEILPAFQGIAATIVPDAKPALDCPVVMPYAPNAVLIGFIVSTIFATITSLVMLAMGMTFVVPPVIQCFFIGGAAAVLANATGGKKGVIISSVINGILASALPVVLFQFTKGVPGLEAVTMGDQDFTIMGSILGFILSFFK